MIRAQRIFFLILLGIALVLSFFVFEPYLKPIVMGATFAVIVYTPYRWILAALGKRQNIAAALATLLTAAIVIAPLTFFGFRLFDEARSVYLAYNRPADPIANSAIHLIEEQVNAYLPGGGIDIDAYAQRLLQWVIQHTGEVLASAAKMLLYILITLIALFYFLRDGGKIIDKAKALSPLRDPHDQAIFDKLQAAINSVIKGSLLIALIQGLVTGTGLAIFGVPSPVLWGGLAMITALIPNIGTAAVLTPAIIYLFITGEALSAAGLLIWGVVAVGLIDDFLGPKLINRGIKLHPVIILLAVLGGLAFFGPIGYILGPLTVSLLVALLDMYPRIMRS